MRNTQRLNLGCALALVWTTPVLAQDQAGASADQDRDEIIVTATRRETTLQETPAAISVVGGDQIEKRNLVGMEDYLATVPGVSYGERGAGMNNITIRGIGQGEQLSANTPVGSYFGEVPVTGLGPPLNGNGAGNADVKMIDVARVEVLRGPQGTLYGSGSMGGTVRVIPNAPNLTKFEGSAQAGLSQTARNGGINYLAEGVVNVPIIQDQLAVRVVGFYHFNDGFIKNVAVSNPTPQVNAAVAIGALREDRNHVGAEKFYGGRVSALWTPFEGFSLTGLYSFQRTEQDGFREVQTNLPGAYLQSRVKVGEGGKDDEFVNLNLNIYNLVAEYDAGWGKFLNSTSVVHNFGNNDIELTFFGAPYQAVSSYTEARKRLFVNEFRFASDFDLPVQLIAGLYYEKRRTITDAVVRYAGTVSPIPNPVVAVPITSENESLAKQYAAFGELAFTPWDPLTLTVGARYFKFKQAILVARTLGVPNRTEGTRASVDGVNWKVNLAYKASDEVFIYGQWAQGFRSPQIQRPILPEYDADNDGLLEFREADGSIVEIAVREGLLDPDFVDNYEIGVRWQSDDNRVRGGLTGYYIDWSGIPVSPRLTAVGGQAFYFNAGKAVSKGIEFELSGKVSDTFLADFTASWNKSTLATAVTGLGGNGSNLPGSADHNLRIGLEKRFNFGENDGFIRGGWSYVSPYYTNFTETGQQSGDYHMFDATAGINFENVRVSIYGRNLTNRKNFVWVDNIFGPAAARAYRLRPRTIGVNVGMNF
jgi:outer membrane receptor protein involved in Fe transport